MSFRIGSGVDFHQLAEGRALWIGGHSDADVLLHAICDALLGALALGDIGIHFPNTDPTYKDIDSKVLLGNCYSLITQRGYKVVNVDSTLCLEAPKIKPYVSTMCEVIAGLLQISKEDVSVKATTTEKMGFAGREEGLMAYATVLLQKI
jgi:2-C-methyl-D-erythritol 2,4-cyclodiphosphate synthase